jgi:hypothetical protein
VVDDARDGSPPVPASQPGQTAPANQRVVSADELLDLNARPADREPLFRLPQLGGSRRYHQFLRAALTAVAVAAVAGAAGVATHTGDLHRAANQQRDRTLLRLVGGGMTLTYPTPVSFDGPLATLMQISVRNDSAQPQTIISVTLDAPGITITANPGTTTLQPGHAAAIGLRIAVDCDRKDLVEAPKSVTLRVRDASAASSVTSAANADTAGTSSSSITASSGTNTAKAADPKVSDVTLPFSNSSGSTANLVLGMSVTGNSFYELCGLAQMTDNGPVTSYVGPSVRATQAKPIFAFLVTVRTSSQRGSILAATKPYQTFPGLAVTAELPAGAAPLTSETPAQVTVTLRVTDCAALSKAVSADSGVRNLVSATSQLPLAGEPADPRYRSSSMSRPLQLSGGFSAFEEDLLLNLIAACPGLK